MELIWAAALTAIGTIGAILSAYRLGRKRGILAGFEAGLVIGIRRGAREVLDVFEQARGRAGSPASFRPGDHRQWKTGLGNPEEG